MDTNKDLLSDNNLFIKVQKLEALLEFEIDS